MLFCAFGKTTQKNWTRMILNKSQFGMQKVKPLRNSIVSLIKYIHFTGLIMCVVNFQMLSENQHSMNRGN